MAVYPGSALAPEIAEQGYQLASGHTVALIRAHVVIALVCQILVLLLGNLQISKQRLQHMLERTGRIGIAHHDLPACLHGPHTVRDDPVVGKITAADHISGPGSGNGTVSVRKEGLLIAVSHQLGTGFAVGIRIIAIQRIALPVSILPLPVLIHLVGGHIQKGLHGRRQAHALQHIHRAHHIGLIGVDRILVGIPHDGLCSQMQHDLRLYPVKDLFQMPQIPDISDHTVHGIRQPGNRKQGRVGRCLGRITGHLRTGQCQDPAQPGALKAGVTGHQNALSLIKIPACIQIILHCILSLLLPLVPTARYFSKLSLFLPDLPWCVAGLPQHLQKLHLTLRIHALPETIVIEGHELSLCCQASHRLLFKHSGIILQIGENFRIQHHETAVDDGAVGCCLLSEGADCIVRTDIQHALLLVNADGRDGRGLSVRLVELHQSL